MQHAAVDQGANLVPEPEPARRPSIGLVLGAGGVRGCAHAGAISVLREAQVPVDLVVGASIGAMFGLAVAAGLPTDYIVRVVRETSPLQITRFYAGRLRPDRSNPISRMIYDAAGDKHFSDLPIPFAVLATDIETGKPSVINRGPVLRAVQASIALPFVARPVAVDGRFYLDGGLMDTAPVGVARALGAERVIAVCLGYNYTAPAFLRRHPWTKPLLERIGRPTGPISGRLRDQVRFGCRLYASSYEPPTPAQDADITIWPDFGRIGPNSMVGAQFCFKQGEEATRAALEQITALYSPLR